MQQGRISMAPIRRGIYNDHEANGEAPEHIEGQESFLLLHVSLKLVEQ